MSRRSGTPPASSVPSCNRQKGLLYSEYRSSKECPLGGRFDPDDHVGFQLARQGLLPFLIRRDPHESVLTGGAEEFEILAFKLVDGLINPDAADSPVVFDIQLVELLPPT